MTGRRAFLKTAAGLLASQRRASAARPCREILRNARALVATGRLGRVWLCRIPDAELAGDLEFVLESQPRPIIDVDAAAGETVLLGSEATLVISRRGLRLFCHAARKLGETSGDLIALD